MRLPPLSSPIWYAHGKFRGAVEILATSPHAIRERLYLAASEFSPVGEEDLPHEAARKALRSFRTRTHWAIPDHRDGVARALALVSDREVYELAALVVEIAWAIDWHLLGLALAEDA